MRGGINPETIVFLPGLLELYMYRIIYGPGGTLSSPGATELHEPQPISDQPVGLGLPHHAGRYRPGRPSFSFLVGWSFI